MTVWWLVGGSNMVSEQWYIWWLSALRTRFFFYLIWLRLVDYFWVCNGGDGGGFSSCCGGDWQWAFFVVSFFS